MKTPSILNPKQSHARHDARAQDRSQSFPRTDFLFRSPATATGAVATRIERAAASSAELRAFRQMSSDRLAEGKVSYLVEMLVFALVIGLIAWPLISLLIVMSQTARW